MVAVAVVVFGGVARAQVVPVPGSAPWMDSMRASPLGQNMPNPFTAGTVIPFTIGDYPVCQDSRTHHVTLRVYNILSQLVAIPVIEGTTESTASMELGCGEYRAYWDGNGLSGAPAGSGVYLYRLEIDGKPFNRKMLRAR